MQLEKLTKTELLNIIGKMKKKEIIDIINNKIGGSNNSNIIKETPHSIRKKIIFDSKKLEDTNIHVFRNNSQYNNMYIEPNKNVV